MSAADATWIAAAITDGDRDAAARGVVDADGFHVRLLAIEEETYRLAYDTVSNGVLWFAHHGLWDLVRQPSFDRSWPAAWDAYRAVNAAFRSEEHTSELQSLMRNSYAVFCLKKK